MENKIYISRVHLKGYKSIRDTEVGFMSGLNIIIGPNGSGKTNFLAFLKNAIRRDFLEIGNFEVQIETTIGEGYYWKKVKKGDKVLIEAKGKKMLSNQINSKLLVEGKVLINKEVIDSVNITIEEGKAFTIVYSKDFYSHFSLCTFIEHSYPSNMLSITEPARIEFDIEEGRLLNVNAQFDFKRDYYFVHLFQQRFAIELDEPKDIVAINPKIVDALKKYTIIEDIRLNTPHFIVFERAGSNQEISHFTIENILTEFKVNGKWLKWHELSDGTKRMFYLISKITYETMPVNCELILVEEPELGVHPNQLSRLMDFLREQSREKQIIITTHSPQVLNELGADELNRVVVTRYEGERGTQMYHLSEEEKGFAKGYMENGAFLSDYWVQSGFMNEEEIV